MFLCLFSGIVLCFYYRPFGNVFKNVEEITTLVPFGCFFRQLHFASGQLFVILMLLHSLEHFMRKRYRSYPSKIWIYLICSLCLCFYALFTGFILKGDKEGLFAAQIFMNIIRGLPFLGETLSKLFILPGKDLFFMPYLYHCFFVPALIILLIKDHIVRWIPAQNLFFVSVFGLSLYALLVRPLIDIPPEAIVPSVSGPWFFLGIQSLLKMLPATLAGLILPGLFVGGLLALPFLDNHSGKQLSSGAHSKKLSMLVYALIVFGAIFYTLLTIKTAIWGP